MLAIHTQPSWRFEDKMKMDNEVGDVYAFFNLYRYINQYLPVKE